MAGALVAVGVASFLSPQCMFGVPGMMACSKGSLSPSQRERLSHALAARRNAEGIFGRGYGRLFTVLCVAAAGMEFVPGVPYVLPYAIICIGLALITYLGYIQFRRAAERRVAPLERRSVLAALPLVSICQCSARLRAALMFTIVSAAAFGRARRGRGDPIARHNRLAHRHRPVAAARRRPAGRVCHRPTAARRPRDRYRGAGVRPGRSLCGLRRQRRFPAATSTQRWRKISPLRR